MRYVLAVVLSLTVMACVNPQIQDPATRRAVTADQVIKGVNALENFAIKANQDGALKDNVSVRLVKAVVDVDTALKDAPVGWQAAAITLWNGLHNDLKNEKLPPTVQTALEVVDGLVTELQGGGQ